MYAKHKLVVLHVTQYCHARSTGGTERYILELVKQLSNSGHRNVIGWLTREREGSFESEGVSIFCFPGAEMRIDPASRRIDQATKVLFDSHRPDVVHFHTFGRSEARIARQIRRRGIPYVFTFHSPGWICRREDLLAFGGSDPCDGQVRTFRCSACKLHERLGRCPEWLARLLTACTAPVAVALFSGRQNGFRRRAAFVADTYLFRRDLNRFLHNASCVVACSEWSVPVVQRNGAVADQLRLIPQGVSTQACSSSSTDWQRSADALLTIAYIGRVTPVKGTDILVESFARIKDPDVRLRIIGWPKRTKGQNAADENFWRSIEDHARKDSRIQLVPKLSFDGMLAAYQEIDLLCIPSVWLETGPLVLFEALQLGIPVLGSRNIGQLQLLECRGTVVDPNTPDGWQHALQTAIRTFRAGYWEQERQRAYNNGELRSMKDVAYDMLLVYQQSHEQMAGVVTND